MTINELIKKLESLPKSQRNRKLCIYVPDVLNPFFYVEDIDTGDDTDKYTFINVVNEE